MAHTGKNLENMKMQKIRRNAWKHIKIKTKNSDGDVAEFHENGRLGILGMLGMLGKRKAWNA